jgi:ribosomal protein L36
VTEKLHPTLLSSLAGLGAFHDDMLKRSKVVFVICQSEICSKKEEKKEA